MIFDFGASSTSSSHEQHPLVSPLGNSRLAFKFFNVFECDVPIQYPLNNEILAIDRAVSGLIVFDFVLVFVLMVAAATEDDEDVENESVYIAVDDSRVGSTICECIATLRTIDAAILMLK